MPFTQGHSESMPDFLKNSWKSPMNISTVSRQQVWKEMSWGIAQTPPRKTNPYRIPQECRKNPAILPNIFSTLLVITNLYGVYIPSIIFITRDQKEITTGGCKLFTQGPCLSKQREQLSHFNHLYGGRNITTRDMWRGILLSCTSNLGGAIYISRKISEYIAVANNKCVPRADCNFYTRFTSNFFLKLISIITSLLRHSRERAGSWERSDDGALWPGDPWQA